MSTLGKIHTTLGITLVAAFALVAGAASADPVEDGKTGEAAQAFAPGLRCTVSSGTSQTGREWARLVIIKERDGQVYCSRQREGRDAPRDWPSCHERRDELGCTDMID